MNMVNPENYEINSTKYYSPYSQEAGIKPLENGISPEDVENRSYLSYVRECADLLIKYGTDRYGEKKLPLLVTLLDVRTRNCPEYPPRTTTGPGARPPYFPTPYRNWHYGEADLSWGNYQAYNWQPLEINGYYDTYPDKFNQLEFKEVTAFAICIEVQLAEEYGGGIYEWKLNGQQVKADKVAGTYFVEGASQNSTYANQVLVNEYFDYNLEALNDGMFPCGDSDKEVPAFIWQEREIGYTEEKEEWSPRKGTREWVMYEFDKPVAIENLEVYWVDDGIEFKVPQKWQALYATSMNKSKVKYPLVVTVPWRGENRDSFWRPRANDFYEDQPTYRTLYQLSTITGKSMYEDFADKSLACALKMSGEKGMFWWGSHRYYDVFTDKKMTPNGDYHEMLNKRPLWELMWQINEEKTRQELEGIWQWHVVDKETGKHNRHNIGKPGHAFAASGGQFIYALSYLYYKTNNEKYLKSARKVAYYHWNRRDEQTGLVPSDPDSGERWDAHHCGHQIVGFHCYYLLKSYELTGYEVFKDYALSYLKAYAKYAYDDNSGKFYGIVRVRDGKPAVCDRTHSDYKSQLPSGYTDLWQPYQYGWEHPIHAAQIYAYAYTVTGDNEVLSTGKNWADFIRNNPPESGCRTDTWYELYARLFSKYGTFAGLYGRTISFYLNMYANTGEKIYLKDAREFAREAVSKLYYNGLFQGHPVRPYYSTIDGVGHLMAALVQLDQVLHLKEDIIGKKLICEDGIETIGFDNW